MSDARRYAVWPEPRSRSLKGSRPSVPHGTNFYHWYVFCLLVVLLKLTLLAKWSVRKTPLRKPNCGEVIISIKPRPKRAYDFVGYCILSLFYCMIFVLSPGPMWYISYFCGMILPICAESTVKHHLTNFRSSKHIISCRIQDVPIQHAHTLAVFTQRATFNAISALSYGIIKFCWLNFVTVIAPSLCCRMPQHHRFFGGPSL